jgi:hypothetical protein
MLSSLAGIDAKYSDEIAVAILKELREQNIDESRAEVSGHPEAGANSVLSVGVSIDGAASRPMLIETDNFKGSLEGQMDVLRAWLRSGYPAQVSTTNAVQYRKGDRVPVPGTAEPLVAVRDSRDNRVWVVNEQSGGDPGAEPIPYLIFPDGSLVKEQQHGLPD